MPHAIFFHYGFAIHGTNDISRLGGPASHGCVRLHPSNAATLFALVQRNGARNTTIEISNWWSNSNIRIPLQWSPLRMLELEDH
jgi:lipoprotein-anchoring transpeptidase ErfK/SrfK